MDSTSLNVFATMSYGAAGLAFACLAVLMAISWRGAPRGIALIAAVGMTAAWGIVLALGATRDLSVLTTYVVETLADCAWLTALVVLGGPLLKRGLRVLAVAVGATACLAPAILWGLERLEVFYADPATLIQRTQLALSFCGLILLEQIYRNPTPGGRKSTRWFVVGVALLFACDLLLYSHAELRGGMSFEFWSARGLLYVFVAPLIAVSAQRTRDWSVDVFVSRQVVFYSTTVLLSLAYLAVVVVGGYYVRQLGGEWGRVGQLVFLVGAVVALAGILSSATLRRHAAVFLSKHFYRNKYDYRIEWLRFIRTLSSTDEPDVRRTAVRAIAQIFDSPGGLLFLKDSDEPRFVLQAAWPASLELSDKARPVALHDDLAEFLVRRHWIIDLRELRVAPEVYDNISVPDWLMEMPALRLVAPLLQLDEVVGFICLCDPPRPFKLTYEDRDLLKTVGRHVATHIAQDDASRRLAESRQFEAYNRLTAFMMHDLKNSVAQLKLIVDNSVRHKHNPEFVDDAIETIRNAVERISKLIEQLRGRRELERLEEVDLGAIVQQAARRCADRQPRPTVEVTEISRVMANNERLTSVIEHILRNAQDATAENGSINVQVSRTDAGARVTVTDTGTGMEADFVRDRLFRPFDSTKGAKGMGIGAYQAREYIRSLGGTVEVQSTPHVGTSFSFTLPRVEDAQGRSNEPMQARASGPV